MRRILLVASTTLVAVVLLLGHRTGLGPVARGTSAVAAAGPSTGTSTGTSTTTYDGAVATTRWGPVQVRLTVAGGRVVAAEAVQVPTGNHRDEEINAYAVPVLDAEAVAAQSADIDTVSGATVTSDGYRTSLQSALDAAHL